eukprot:CAMPEP_0113600612 /NCGR_PEP_ID=MMETSP0015_2-20120614/42794_1 /TAXON_ID=2838 /ORGANISM="Odontella" /LENGTH=135 /DNA_ID=CAMNT_0000508869 /DNA_START=475 /DNA_END=879 /DNA_ORIENTATION=- /assembly_acc=CAM_ASM_000160
MTECNEHNHREVPPADNLAEPSETAAAAASSDDAVDEPPEDDVPKLVPEEEEEEAECDDGDGDYDRDHDHAHDGPSSSDVSEAPEEEQETSGEDIISPMAMAAEAPRGEEEVEVSGKSSLPDIPNEGPPAVAPPE